jgi:hypothetical protein
MLFTRLLWPVPPLSVLTATPTTKSRLAPVPTVCEKVRLVVTDAVAPEVAVSEVI